MWDELGLLRETDVPGQSWNQNGISTFFHQLKFEEYLTWDAIYWRTGYLDREAGEHRDSFVHELDATMEVVTLEDQARRAEILARYSDSKSMWFQVARHLGMRDHMILAFETTRTRSIDTVDWNDKHEIRHLYYSNDPSEHMKGSIKLTVHDSLYSATPHITNMEAVLGRPYYEITEGMIGNGELQSIDQSVESITDDVINDALRIMLVLHVRPYAFWTSETELMIAAGRPGNVSGPWTRAEIEQTAPMLQMIPGTNPHSNLRDWSNMIRDFYEPGIDRATIVNDDKNLLELMGVCHPNLRTVLESEIHTSDDRELIKRLVRLGRFGYGNAYANRDWLERRWAKKNVER